MTRESFQIKHAIRDSLHRFSLSFLVYAKWFCPVSVIWKRSHLLIPLIIWPHFCNSRIFIIVVWLTAGSLTQKITEQFVNSFLKQGVRRKNFKYISIFNVYLCLILLFFAKILSLCLVTFAFIWQLFLFDSASLFQAKLSKRYSTLNDFRNLRPTRFLTISMSARNPFTVSVT